MACEIKDKIDALNSLLELRSVKNNSKIHGVIQAKRDVLVTQLDKPSTDFHVPKRFRSKVIDSIGKHVDTRIQALKNKDGQDLAPWLMPEDVVFAMRVTEKMVNFVKKLGLDAVKNFGNPFMLSALKDNNNKIDRAIAKQNGEASEMFYNWLKDGTIPATYDGDLDALAKRREFILQNLGKVNKAKAVHYKGTAKGDDVNHAKALSLLAKQVADGEVLIADVNTDDVTIAASAPETIVSTKPSTSNYIHIEINGNGNDYTVLDVVINSNIKIFKIEGYPYTVKVNLKTGKATGPRSNGKEAQYTVYDAEEFELEYDTIEELTDFSTYTKVGRLYVKPFKLPSSVSIDSVEGLALVVTYDPERKRWAVAEKTSLGCFGEAQKTKAEAYKLFLKNAKARSKEQVARAIEKFKKENGVPEEVEYQRTSDKESITANKELYDAIKKQLVALYPNITLHEVDKLFDINNQAVLGKAIRDSVYVSQTDGKVDTLAHEYAHVYINLLETTTYVKNTLGMLVRKHKISKAAAKEMLVEEMGKRIVEANTGKPFKGRIERTVLDRIIDAVKRLFTNLLTPELALELQIQKRVEILSKRLWEGENKDAIRLTPKEGFKLVDPQFDFDNQPMAAEIVTGVAKIAKGDAIFTGSEGLATQGTVYRKQSEVGTDLHDIDFAVKTDATVKEISKYLKEKYSTMIIADFNVPVNQKLFENAEQLLDKIPQLVVLEPLGRYASRFLRHNHVTTQLVLPKGYSITNVQRFAENKRITSYDVVDSNNKVVGTYTAEVAWANKNKTRTNLLKESTTGMKAFIVDLIEDRTKRNTFVWNYNGTDIYVSEAGDIFKAKNQMSPFIARDKDILDANLFSRHNKAENKANSDIIEVEGINGTTKEMLPGDTVGLSSEFLQQMNEEKCQ